MGEMIRVEDLVRRFGDIKAVNGISFSVGRGEVVGLLGPNGAGKTTTMRMITSFLSATSGNVFIDGESVADHPLRTRSKIGYLPESCPLYVDMEVTDFLTYIGSLRGVEKTALPDRIREMVRLCGLEDVAGRTIAQLSKGYKQRVGLAQALIHHPPILILDEPTSGLDPNQIVEIRKLIREIGRERTVILSTHILQEVEATCDKAFIISSGRLAGQGTLESLMHAHGGGSEYNVTIRAPKAEIENRIGNLASMSIRKIETAGDGWCSVRMSTSSEDDRAEDIFRWVAENHWTLKELRRDKTSLEEVFRSLTTN